MTDEQVKYILGIIYENIDAIKVTTDVEKRAKEAMKQRYKLFIAERRGSGDYADWELYESLQEYSLVFSLMVQKLKDIELITKEVVKLERHAYSPEQNRLHFKSGNTYTTPYKITVMDAVEKMATTERPENIINIIG